MCRAWSIAGRISSKRNTIGYSEENLKIHTGVPSPPFLPSLTSPPLLPLPAFPSSPLPLPSYIPCSLRSRAP